MRIQLHLNRTSRQKMLPMDYQYYISAWIYKVLKKSDRELAQFLHQKGYGQNDAKLYKLFCFSRLNFGKPKLWKERRLFEISTRDITLQVSFDVNEVATNFIKGLFMEQEFFIGDKFNGIDFRVVGVKALPEPDFQETMIYRLQTPWVVSVKNEGDKHPQYLRAGDDRFSPLAVQHLLEKYNNTRNDNKLEEEQIALKILNDVKRSGFLLKPGTSKETRVVGNLFEFELTAPVVIHQMLWNAGISEKSSSGFGWVETVKEIIH